MKDTYKIQQLENRIAELEKQIDGATVFLSNFAHLMDAFALEMIEQDQIDNGYMTIYIANLLKNPENYPKLFLTIVEKKDAIIAWGKQIEAEIRKMSN